MDSTGEAYSKKITAGRPYNQKDELVQKTMIPQATFDKIKDQIVAKQKSPPERSRLARGMNH